VTSLFVSHSSQDAGTTAELVGRLRAGGFETLFVDFDPDQGIRVGRNWERELYSQLRRADGVLYVASPAANASRWCFAELSLARSIGKPIFPVLVAGTERLALLTDVQWIDLGTDGEQAYGRLFTSLRQAGLDPEDAFAWDLNRPPFPGLDPFRLEDAAVFFGRDAEIGELLDRVTPTLQQGRGQFLAVVGPSGSGKSSLVGAGLLPRLVRRGWITLPGFVPGERPRTKLAISLNRAFAARNVELGVSEVERRLEERGSPALVEFAQQLCGRADGTPVGALVFLDQAEELITRTGAGERAGFLQLLRGALHPHSPVWVLATLRSEFLSTAPERAGLAEVIDDALVVEPLSRRRLPEVIQRPAQRAGLEFEAGLVQRMVNDTVGGDALPLLAYTLRELYLRVGPEETISIADYEALGGVEEGLANRADQVLAELAEVERARARHVFLQLIKTDETAGDTRRLASRIEFDSADWAVVQRLADARLVITDRDLRGRETAEIIHEALIRRWPRLRFWIEDDRAFLRWQEQIRNAEVSWQAYSRDQGALLRGAALAEAERWLALRSADLSSVEQDFIHTSSASEGRAIRRLWGLAGGFVVLLIVALTLTGLARLVQLW
jgi:hypothetical protein